MLQWTTTLPKYLEPITKLVGTWNFEDTKLSMWHNYYTSTCLAYVGTLKKHMTARREVTKSTNYIRDK
jgi:hypothetical protein